MTSRGREANAVTKNGVNLSFRTLPRLVVVEESGRSRVFVGYDLAMQRRLTEALTSHIPVRALNDIDARERRMIRARQEALE